MQNPELAAVLGGLLEPLTEDRMSAREALGLLQGKLTASGCVSPHCWLKCPQIVGHEICRASPCQLWSMPSLQA